MPEVARFGGELLVERVKAVLPQETSDDYHLSAFRASIDLVRTIDRQAAAEGISRSALVRRAVIRDLSEGATNDRPCH